MANMPKVSSYGCRWSFQRVLLFAFCTSLSLFVLVRNPTHLTFNKLLRRPNEASSMRCPTSTYSIVQAHNTSKYPVAFRVIVITYDRASSLSRCIRAANSAYYNEKRVDLHVYVDRSVGGNVSAAVLSTAMESTWVNGAKFVNVWDEHVGLYGQWVDSYQPANKNDYAVILEDDIQVSPYYYLWLKGARQAYSSRDDLFGYTLQRGTVRADRRASRKQLSISQHEPVYLYLLLGSWGYAPEPRVWRTFRQWFHNYSCDDAFNPMVEGLILSEWFEPQRKSKSMWTMWHVWYADNHKLYTAYANLINKKTLATNWREPGLHFESSARKDFDPFLQVDFTSQGGRFLFPSDPVKVDWNGTYIDRSGRRTPE